MPRKGMRSLCFSLKTTSSSSSISHYPSSSRLLTLSDASMDRTLITAENIITKWNPETSTFAKVTSLFFENRREAGDFIKYVNDLQKSMHFLLIEDPNSEKLVRGQNLMAMAMKRLQKEFYQILSTNRAHLDPESVSTRTSRASTRSSTSDYEDEDGSDEIRIAGDSISEVERESTVAMDDLRSIAECMITSGYGRECVKIYKIIRKSIVDEGIYRLGVEKLSSSQLHKVDWEVLELRFKNWLNALKISVKTLFKGERILCDHVFASSESIRESCFSEIAKEGAMILFGFPEFMAKSRKKSPEKVFRLLDMYSAISANWPEIESIFSFDSTSIVKSQAINSLIKLAESVRTMIAEFETTIQKDAGKSSIAGAGIHPLTVQVMNYISLLADYSNVLSDILTDSPPPAMDFSDESPTSLRFSWIVLVLLCKLDGKSKQYKDVSLSYLFLANNIQHVIDKVRTSNLKYLLGDDWLSKHEAKVKQFSANYERFGWDHVIKSLPEDPTADMSAVEVKEWFGRFNKEFEQAYRKQSLCVVPDSKLREEIQMSIGKKVAEVYKGLYETQRVKLGRGERNFVRFTPEDLGNYLSNLFFGTVGSGSSLSFSSHSRPVRPIDSRY